jgi:hypothetical protein
VWVGPSPTPIGLCAGSADCLLEVDGAVLETATSLDYITGPTCVTVDKATNLTNIIANMRTGEIFMAYDESPALTLKIIKGLSMLKEKLYIGQTCFSQAMLGTPPNSDTLKVLGSWYDLPALDGTTPRWTSHNVLEGVDFVLDGEPFETMDDQSGVIGQYTQPQTYKLTMSFPRNISPEFQRKIIPGPPFFVGNHPTPTMWQEHGVSIAGMEIPAIALIIVPERIATSFSERNTDGEIKLTDCIIVPRATASQARTLTYKSGEQQKIEVTYNCNYDSVFNRAYVISDFAYRAANYPSQTP